MIYMRWNPPVNWVRCSRAMNKLGIYHTLMSALVLIGMRDRLRCPECKAVGTWKQHGSIFDREDIRKVRRWMCKWCGLYIGPEGKLKAFPDPARGAWALPRPFDQNSPEIPGRTPKQALAESELGKTWPWRG